MRTLLWYVLITASHLLVPAARAQPMMSFRSLSAAQDVAPTSAPSIPDSLHRGVDSVTAQTGIGYFAKYRITTHAAIGLLPGTPPPNDGHEYLKAPRGVRVLERPAVCEGHLTVARNEENNLTAIVVPQSVSDFHRARGMARRTVLWRRGDEVGQHKVDEGKALIDDRGATLSPQPTGFALPHEVALRSLGDDWKTTFARVPKPLQQRVLDAVVTRTQVSAADDIVVVSESFAVAGLQRYGQPYAVGRRVRYQKLESWWPVEIVKSEGEQTVFVHQYHWQTRGDSGRVLSKFVVEKYLPTGTLPGLPMALAETQEFDFLPLPTGGLQLPAGVVDLPASTEVQHVAYDPKQPIPQKRAQMLLSDTEQTRSPSPVAPAAGAPATSRWLLVFVLALFVMLIWYRIALSRGRRRLTR